jgi:hypothetical protein
MSGEYGGRCLSAGPSGCDGLSGWAGALSEPLACGTHPAGLHEKIDCRSSAKDGSIQPRPPRQSDSQKGRQDAGASASFDPVAQAAVRF